MKRTFFTCLILISLLGLGCDSLKKDKDKELSQEDQLYKRELPEMLDTCAIARIEVSPQNVDRDDVHVESGARVDFSAKAYDLSGNEVPASFRWHFRYPDSDDETQAGHGHRIQSNGDASASMTASGTTPGRFYVTATVDECEVGPVDCPRCMYGRATVEVGQKPGAIAACGELRLVMGLKDMMGQTVLGSDKANLVAEISGTEQAKNKLKVSFYINDKKNINKRPLYGDQFVEPVEGMEKGYKANLSFYPKDGPNRVYYQLLQGGQVICSSKVEEFNAK